MESVQFNMLIGGMFSVLDNEYMHNGIDLHEVWSINLFIFLYVFFFLQSKKAAQVLRQER